MSETVLSRKARALNDSKYDNYKDNYEYKYKYIVLEIILTQVDGGVHTTIITAMTVANDIVGITFTAV